MYRVFGDYVNNPPPYDGKPPDDLKEGVDYQVSYGSSYYDSTWRGPNGEEGAMMEHYEEWSLPIFPMDNHFTSSFISLGDKAYFLTYEKDRPKNMPSICSFSQTKPSTTAEISSNTYHIAQATVSDSGAGSRAIPSGRTLSPTSRRSKSGPFQTARLTGDSLRVRIPQCVGARHR